MAYSIFHLVTAGNVPYDLTLISDSVYKRNILHYAVINKERDLIDLIVSKVDSDRKELRNAEDTKGKKPADYDQSSQFAEYFNTVWDYAKEGNIRKLKLSLDSGRFEVDEQTMLLKNTPLHVAVRFQQLETIKTLIYDYQADPTLVNS